MQENATIDERQEASSPLGNLIEDFARADLQELQEQLSTHIGLALLICGGTLAWAFMPANRYRSEIVGLSLWIALCGLLLYVLRRKAPAVGRLVLLVGPPTVLALYLPRLATPIAPTIGILFVIACSALDPLLGIGSAFLNTLPLLWGYLPGDTAHVAIGLIWLSALFCFIFSRGLYTAIEWAWQSEERAESLVRRLRDRQQVINRNNSLLTEATRRLERTRNELATARAYADEARTAKERFAANISHELRTPLNLILGFAELMHLTPDIYGDVEWPVELRRDIAQIYRSARHLMGLVNDVLELSQLDSMQMPVHREQADLASVVNEACTNMRQLVERQNLDLRVDMPDALPSLLLDTARIRQVLLNLLSNAVRHTSQGGITVSARVEGAEVVVSVADTGCGIPESELEQIFEEYHRIESGLRQARDGVGLGLAISKRFVELHGGRIWVESVEGEGSTFYFTLPRSDVSASSLLRLPIRKPHPVAVRPVVLLIDSDPAVAELLQRHLQDVDVVQARDIAEGRALQQSASPRVVLLNVPPGHQDEPSLRDQAIEMLAPLPIVTLSLPSSSWLSGEMAVQGSLSKPIQRNDLLAEVDRLGGGKVLVADDDRGFVRLMRRYLSASPSITSVRHAYDGVEALRLCTEDPPDLLLLDLIMPEMDGFQLLDALKDSPECASISVIIVTATDYARQLLSSRSGCLSISTSSSLSVQQTLQYLQAIVRVMAPSAEAADQPTLPATVIESQA